jgi:hypothetical protein
VVALDPGGWARPTRRASEGLLDRVEPKRSVIDDLANEGYMMDWFCFVGFKDGQGGVVLGVDVLRRLAALPIELDLDIDG